MKYIDADRLRTEIERNTPFHHRVYTKIILALIDYLQQEQPEVDLEKEAVQFCFDEGLNLTPHEAKTIARHFYELGQRRTAEMYDEIEYNRQRETGGVMEYDAGFKAGSQWLAEQGVSFEANIRDCSGSGYLSLVMPNNLYNRYKSFNDGDRVIVQVRKKEESR